MVSDMQETGNKKPTVKSMIIDLAVAPFFLISSLCLWTIVFISNRHFILIELEEEDEDI